MPDPGAVWDRYRRYLEAPPERVVEWHDRTTGARGWLVMNSMRGGAAGGGTRLHAGVTREEVTYLAKTMELKFTFSGPPIGGAKAGIAFDPADPRRGEVLRRWFEAIRPYLATCYGTGGDVNVDEQRDVVPLCLGLGIRHPQEGVVRGHLHPPEEELGGILDNLTRGIRVPVAGPDLGIPGSGLTVSDLITGWGTATAAERLLARRDRSLEGTRVIVEGFGNVGAACALYLSRKGARVVGVVDERAAVVAPAGIDAAEVEDLLLRRRGRLLPDHPLRVTGSAREGVYATAADLFVPAAISGSVTSERLEALERAGVTMIVSGANQPFRESRLGDTRLEQEADCRFEVIPDAVASLGMARAFCHLMDPGAEVTDRAIFEAVTRQMRCSVDEVVDRAAGRRRGLLSAAVGIALDRSGN